MRADFRRQLRSRSDGLLGCGAAIIFLVLVAGFFPVVYLFLGGITLWRAVGLLVLAGLISIPAIFALDDWLKEKLN